MSLAPGSPVLAIVRVRLAGDDDYEVQVNCPTFADLGDALTRICGCAGVQVTSTALIPHEVSGLGPGRQAIPDEVVREIGLQGGS
jgi:hypothetical protein